MDRELHPGAAVLLPDRHDVGQWVDRALLRAARDGHDLDHRDLVAQAAVQRLAELGDVHPGVEVDGDRDEVRRAEPEQRRALGPRVVAAARHDHDARREAREAQVLDRVALQDRLERRGVDTELRLDRGGVGEDLVGAQVQQFPVVEAHELCGRAVGQARREPSRRLQPGVALQRGGQRDREVLEVAGCPHRLDVGHAPVAGDVPPRHRRTRGVRDGVHGRDRVAEHRAQVAPDLHLEQRGHRGGLRRHVVLVVEGGREVAEHGRDRDVPQHVGLVAVAEERHRSVEPLEQVVQARLELLHPGLVGGRLLDLVCHPQRVIRLVGEAIRGVSLQRRGGQAREDVRVLGLRPEEPRRQRVGSRDVEPESVVGPEPVVECVVELAHV